MDQREQTSLISMDTVWPVWFGIPEDAFCCFQMHHRVRMAKVCAALVSSSVKAKNQSSR